MYIIIPGTAPTDEKYIAIKLIEESQQNSLLIPNKSGKEQQMNKETDESNIKQIGSGRPKPKFINNYIKCSFMNYWWNWWIKHFNEKV